MKDIVSLDVYLLAICVVITGNCCYGKTVIMFPIPTRSYVLYHSKIAMALAELGHSVHICLTEHSAKEGLVRESDRVHFLTYGQNLGNVEQTLLLSTNLVEKFWKRETVGLGMSSLKPLADHIRHFVTEVMSDNVFIEKYKSLNPDLFILESTVLVLNMVVLPYAMGTPFALLGTLHDMILTRTPFSPAVEPFPHASFTNRMTFLERVESTLMCLARLTIDPLTDDSLVASFAPHKPQLSVYNILRRAEVFIAETDSILDYPRPMMVNTKLIGGSSATEPRALQGQFKTFVNESPKGLAVVTFGASDHKVPASILDKMMSAFTQLDLSVIWKRDNMTSPVPPNVLTSEWIPQNDLLGHPKTKVFVSHCGKNGQYESLYQGVPILCLPIYGDQFYNSKRIVTKEFGLDADIRDITSEELAQLIQRVAYDPKYRNNIQKASMLFKELYKVPSKEAAYWFDHVMRYGGDYMRSPGQEMPFYQFLLLDVMAFVTLVVVIYLLIMYAIFRLCFTWIQKRRHEKIKLQ
ncbi:UDP-glucuronosyltransferase 1-1 [Biomphalaria glabrata]|nr:UDP-glucuronosyltransferase 1-1 [Biomphalaria glabrata]